MVSMTDYGTQLEAALATEIKIELVARDWSQETLAKAVGIERATLTRYMTGKRSMPMPTFFAIAETFGLSPRALMERAESRIRSAG